MSLWYSTSHRKTWNKGVITKLVDELSQVEIQYYKSDSWHNGISHEQKRKESKCGAFPLSSFYWFSSFLWERLDQKVVMNKSWGSKAWKKILKWGLKMAKGEQIEQDLLTSLFLQYKLKTFCVFFSLNPCGHLTSSVWGMDWRSCLFPSGSSAVG